MDVATAQALWSVLVQIISAVIQYGPAIIVDAEKVISNLELAWQSVTSGTPITPDQQAQIDQALDDANNALQAAVTAQQAQV